MSAINQANLNTAADVRAAALAFTSRERPISAASRYASALGDALPTLKMGSSVTFTNTRDGTTVDGKPIAKWLAKLGTDPAMYYPSSIAARQRPTDTITLSPQASALIANEKIALAVVNKIMHVPTAPPEKADDKKTVPNQTGALEPETDGPHHVFSSAADFEREYLAEAADGPAGRFYKSTDPQYLAPIMSDDEYASFEAAFNSRTLTIQAAGDASGVKFEGSVSMTFFETAIGGGESFGSQGPGVDTSELQKTARYALIGYDGFFGPTVISWGGPPEASATPAEPSPAPGGA